MLDVICGGNLALDRDYYYEEESWTDPRSGFTLIEQPEEDVKLGWKMEILTGIGFLLMAFIPPLGALMLWGLSKQA